MDQPKPEIIERDSAPSRSEVEKAEVNLRALERAQSNQSDNTRTALKVADIKPNSTYEKNGYIYQTDSLARTKHVSGSLRLEKGIRNSNIQNEVRGYGVKGDHGGHIIGAQFNGPPDAFNLFPQNSDFNAGKWSESAWANMEREWASYLKSGKTVNVSVDLRYGDSSKRPTELYVRYVVSDGKVREIFFQNQANNQIRSFSAEKV